MLLREWSRRSALLTSRAALCELLQHLDSRCCLELAPMRHGLCGWALALKDGAPDAMRTLMRVEKAVEQSFVTRVGPRPPENYPAIQMFFRQEFAGKWFEGVCGELGEAPMSDLRTGALLLQRACCVDKLVPVLHALFNRAEAMRSDDAGSESVVPSLETVVEGYKYLVDQCSDETRTTEATRGYLKALISLARALKKRGDEKAATKHAETAAKTLSSAPAHHNCTFDGLTMGQASDLLVMLNWRKPSPYVVSLSRKLMADLDEANQVTRRHPHAAIILARLARAMEVNQNVVDALRLHEMAMAAYYDLPGFGPRDKHTQFHLRSMKRLRHKDLALPPTAREAQVAAASEGKPVSTSSDSDTGTDRPGGAVRVRTFLVKLFQRLQNFVTNFVKNLDKPIGDSAEVWTVDTPRL